MTNIFSLEGRVALVTGSAQGLGNIIARGMKDAGAKVVLSDVNPATLQAAAAELGVPGYAFDISNEPQVVEASQAYVWWAYLIPAAGVAAFIWDGLFIGTTQTRGMLISSAVAAILFFVTATITMNRMGNHGLWLSMILYLLTRGIVQTIIVKN